MTILFCSSCSHPSIVYKQVGEGTVAIASPNETADVVTLASAYYYYFAYTVIYIINV